MIMIIWPLLNPESDGAHSKRDEIGKLVTSHLAYITFLGMESWELIGKD